MSDEQDPARPPAADDLAPLPGPDELITLAQAARISGLTPGALRNAVAAGRLQVQPVTPRLNMMTRRWLHAFLDARGSQQGPGAPPKPLPAGYQPPGPGRPRKPAVRKTTTETSRTEESQQ